MGKKQKLKEARRLDRDSVKEEAAKESRDPNRRMRRALIGGGLGVIALGGYLAWDSLFGDDWEFIDIDTTRQAEDGSYVISHYVPIGPEKEVPDKDPDKPKIQQEMEPHIRQQIAKRGFDFDVNYKITLTEQLFGIPLEEGAAEDLENYCKRAVEKLYTSIDGLEPVNIRWIPLRKGDNYSTDFRGRGFIGMSVYKVYTAFVVNPQNPSQNFPLFKSEHSSGSKLRVQPTENSRDIVDYWTIFIGAGPSGLLAPFSEVLPVTTKERDLAYINEVGEEMAMEAAEAFSEAVRYILARELVRELEVDRGIEHIESSHERLRRTPKYRFVPLAIRWMQDPENGIQKGFNLYMKNPGEFMEAIGAYK